MDFSQNYFQLFGLQCTVDIDQQALKLAYRELQQQFHPDRFVQEGEQQQRLAMQTSAFINEAYTALSDSLACAVYMLSLHDIDLDSESDTAMDHGFLMVQMELREQMEDVDSAADPYVALDALNEELDQQFANLLNGFSVAFTQQDFQEARALARKMQFFNKLKKETGRIEDRLD